MEKAPSHLEVILRHFDDFTPRQLDQLAMLEGLYTEFNEKVNVISRKDIGSLYSKHVLHSLSIAAVADFQSGLQILDIGTGGGFPGIPLAIFFPEVQFHLADSIAKKIGVVNSIVEATGLTNVVTHCTRVEQLKLRFDYTVSRAVAPLKELWGWSKPLLRRTAAGKNSAFAPGLICLKGGDLLDEIAASGTRPSIIEITEIFPEEQFAQKFLLHIPL